MDRPSVGTTVSTVVVHSLSRGAARRVVAAAMDEADRTHDSVAVVVVSRLRVVLAAECCERAPAASFEVALAKALHSISFNRPTSYQDDLLSNGTLQVLAVPGMLPLAGGIPLELERQLVGSVGVSGAASTRDEEIARAAAAVLTSDLPAS